MVVMDLELRGQSVDRVCLDSALTLFTSGDVEMRIETDATLMGADGIHVRFDPESPGPVAGRIVELLHSVISTASYSDAGVLSMSFEGGEELTAPPHDEYEAWGVVYPDGRRIVCVPDGEVAIWGPI
ncbi:DUF6188 family protein [Streptomyces sp. R41]|uniref:DUF6188 family protein n=1 Tax=Streptomyces sp. R41 TaxID=3238632 RepID=A0AB39R7G3_9ACTN